MFPIILKFLVITGLLIAGAFFLAKGLGVDIPMVKYNGLEAYNVPVGFALLATAVAIAKFWKIQKTGKTNQRHLPQKGAGAAGREGNAQSLDGAFLSVELEWLG